MTELKTLKDIREKAIKDICKNLKVDTETLCSFGQLGMMSVEVLVTTFLRDDLRKEAIKIYKLIEKTELHEDYDKIFGEGMIGDNVAEPAAIMMFIEKFFNLTEEDITGKIKPDEHLPSARGVK